MVCSYLVAFDEYVHSYADPRVLVYPFMASMWPNVIFCFSYLFLILYGQRFMTPRPPLRIPQFVMIFYNGLVVGDGWSVVNCHVPMFSMARVHHKDLRLSD